MKGLSWGSGFDSGLKLAVMIAVDHMRELDPDYTLATEYDETCTPAHLIAVSDLVQKIYGQYLALTSAPYIEDEWE